MTHHEHKYYLGNVKTYFEPVDTTIGNVQLYEMVEYAIMVCNCGEAKKVLVKQGDNNDL